MASRDKQSLIQAWLNPDKEDEAAVIEIVNRKRSEGYTAKAVIVDAILRADGQTPVHFTEAADPLAAMILRHVRRIVAGAVQQQTGDIETLLREALADMPAPSPKTASPAGNITDGMQNLANAFLERENEILD